ncbi:alanine racemase [Mesorhizobium sp. NPDC059054]|uniref:alanine racemase n=1 Tax=unclassified Mesorhizobium TaxID=325217 RepID=UPI00369BCC15
MSESLIANHMIDEFRWSEPETSAYMPILDKRVRSLLAHQQDLHRWVGCFGSPLHLIFPEIAFANGQRWLTRLRAIMEQVDVRFGMKACKSDALTMALSLSGTGMDVSSAGELLASLRNYTPRERVSFTGPDKPDHELALCLAHDISVSIDSFSELDRFIQIQTAMMSKGKPVLRYRPPLQINSRFGFTADELFHAAQKLHASGIMIEGVAFHLSGYSSLERVCVAKEALKILQQLASRDIHVRSLSLGGGFLVSYLAHRPSTVEPPKTWQNKRLQGGYSYFSDSAADRQAEQILCELLSDLGCKSVIDELNLKLIVEPGRALTDQCGGTLMRVLGVKRTAQEMDLLILDGMSFSLSETWFSSDFLPEPFLVPQGLQAREPDKRTYVLAGRSCLESDMIRWTAVEFSIRPRPGDLIYFHNTAGYQMDSNESTFHRISVPRKVAVSFANGQLNCLLDSEVDVRSFVVA